MSKSIQLNTSTVNFLDLFGNGKRYRVPPYQRDYSWEEEQWEDLWNDILDMYRRQDERHYMGALVVEEKDDRDFEIIDGQQRLATLSIIGLAVLNQLRTLVDGGIDPEANRERAAELRKRFIGEKDPASLLESSKLYLNENDNAFYQDCLVQLRSPLNPRGLSSSNRLLWECFQYYSREIGAIDALAGKGETLAAFLNETVARQLFFLLIALDDELNAYTVFETLNARRMELTATDLLKNFLFSKVEVPSDLEALQRRWRSLIATVSPERFPEFLRFHLLCECPRINPQRLFNLLRERIATARDVFALLGALESRSEFFAALSDPHHEYWLERPECRPYIRELNLFQAPQLTPPLFAAWERFDRNNFMRVLKLAGIVAFRYTAVAGLNPNALEPVSHAAAKAILTGAATGPGAVFNCLRSIYVDDVKFVAVFSTLELPTQGRKKKLAKYVLCRLESDASGKDCDYETDSASIEHILPENPSSTWEDAIPVNRWDKLTYRLGNLTLLEARLNRDIGNDGYGEKLVKYSESNYALTKQVCEMAPEEWTEALINRRQHLLAERAAQLWRSDFV